MKNRHGTSFEHNAMTFYVKAPIAVFREFQRHRIGFSYNEVSGRYKKLDPVFYVPPPERPLVQVGKPGEYKFIPGSDEQYAYALENLRVNFSASWDDYENLLEAGIAKEVARGVLPVYIYSEMYVTCNARSLMSFLALRTYEDWAKFQSFPMWEIEQVARSMESVFAQLFPLTYDSFNGHGRVSP